MTEPKLNIPLICCPYERPDETHEVGIFPMGSGYPEWWQVQCSCGAAGPKDLGESGACEAWNNRPLEAMLLEACEEADMVLEYWIEFPNWIVRDLEADKAHDILRAAIRAAKEGTE